ncbi:MAG: zinc ribbon domain-containing protein [Eubacterium sp.]|nr:zinc ribbon domain-containing protein [Eubacterium sp.]
MDKIKIKHIIQIISLVAIVVFFLPTFVVSCSGESISLSSVRLMIGINSDGYTLISPQVGIVVLLILPVLMLLLWLLKLNLDYKIKNILTLVFAAVDFVLWCVVAGAIRMMANQYYCQSHVTFWFVLNIILLIIAILIAIGLNLKKLNGEMDLTQLFGVVSATTSTVVNELDLDIKSTPQGATPQNASEGAEWCCPNCGTQMRANAKFCLKCGTAKPIVETKPAARFCPNCGTKAEEDAVFCENCGTKIL